MSLVEVYETLVDISLAGGFEGSGNEGKSSSWSFLWAQMPILLYIYRGCRLLILDRSMSASFCLYRSLPLLGVLKVFSIAKGLNAYFL